eukprot:2956015-Karenia_brevis.AAC.1
MDMQDARILQYRGASRIFSAISMQPILLAEYGQHKQEVTGYATFFESTTKWRMHTPITR